MGTPPVVRANRHPLLIGLVLLVPILAAGDPVGRPPLVWHDATIWGVEGRAWGDLARGRWFDRLPSIAEGRVSAQVWELSHDSAGLMVRFRTDATAIWVHYVLSSSRLADTNMPATGVSGVDLYARDDAGQWRWVGVTKPESRDCTAAWATDLAPGPREYAAYLPLRNGVDSLAIGVPAGAHFEGLPPRRTRPIVFYGTSITHGYCASRPGMTHLAILGRHLDRPVINLGFNGNGRMDAAVGELLCRIDAAAYVIDCLPNMEPEEVRQRCPPLVRMLRAARPKTPIVLVEDRRNANAWIRPARDLHHTDNHVALRAAYASLVREGLGPLFYIPGDHLYGDDGEGSTDGSHPSDLGFMRQAAVFEPVLRSALSAP
jgi:lysophospholipase L1-like esterase